MKSLNFIAVTALIAGTSPIVFDALPTGMGDTGAAYAKNDGNRGGENRGGSGRDRENTGRPEWAGSGSSNGERGASARADRPVNVHAHLKGLNSLNRNINGLMNSADPKMDMFREFILANADYQEHLDQFAEGLEGFDPDGSFQETLESLGLPMPTNPDEFKAMTDQLLAMSTAPIPLPSDYDDDTEYQTALEAWMISTAVASDALDQYENSEFYGTATDTFAAQDASSEEAMIDAMVGGLNATGAGPVTTDDMSLEMIEWVASQLGVGDSDGLIDDYLLQIGEMQGPEAPPEDDAGEGETDS